jgi:CRP-like cAMP-binding protein
VNQIDTLLARKKKEYFTLPSTEILNKIGHFSIFECELFEKFTSRLKVDKNNDLLKEGEICKSFYFVLQGSFIQYKTHDTDEYIVDLHANNEWMFNQQSLTEQLPSTTNLKAFSNSEVLSLSLNGLHYLCSKSQAFLQFGKILNQTKHRTTLYDDSLNPLEKYQFILNNKPELLKIFPLKVIASYLKISPETLSRVRATYNIS